MEYWIIYLTTCTINNKIYIGVHKTNDPYNFDGYLGCGVKKGNTLKNPKTAFQRAVKKYGYDSFKRVTLFTYDNEKDAYNHENQIVTEEFIKRKDVYNSAIGGKGGVTSIYSTKVLQYDINGNFIKEYDSIPDVCKNMKLSKASLYDCISKKYPLKGFFYIRLNSNINDIIKTYNDKKVNKIKNVSKYLNNKLIETFTSLTIASKETKLKYHSIKSAIYNNSTCGGFQWSYYDYDEFKEYNKKDFNKKPLKVAQYDLDNNLIKTYDRLIDAAKEYPKCRLVLKGLRTHTKGFIFKFVD